MLIIKSSLFQNVCVAFQGDLKETDLKFTARVAEKISLGREKKKDKVLIDDYGKTTCTRKQENSKLRRCLTKANG